VHLREYRARRGSLALERLDPTESPQDGARFVHASTLAMPTARVCVRIVSKAIRFIPAVAPNPDRELGEARAAIDRGDSPAALKRLDRARRGYLNERDSEGLDHVLDMARLVDTTEDRARIGRENLAYAVKQNLRQESRRQAQERKETWADPYPDLRAPTEHTGLVLTRGVKIAVGIGVLAGTAAVVGLVLASVLVDSGSKTMVTLRLDNTTGRTVTVRACADGYCPSREIGPGDETETKLDADKLVQVFRLDLPGTDKCLPLRVHDAYQLFGKPDALQATLSQATSCPGTTVLPRPGGSKGSLL
jgi:hypothetical protein